MTFSNRQREQAAAVTTSIQGKLVEIVEEYKYLGTIFDNNLKFASNTEDILRKCQQRQYLLRKLSSIGVKKDILTTVYFTFIECHDFFYNLLVPLHWPARQKPSAGHRQRVLWINCTSYQSTLYHV